MVVAELLADVEVDALEGGVAELRPRGANPLTVEALRRDRAAVEAALSRAAASRLRVRVRGEAEPAPATPSPEPSRAQRLSAGDARTERTRAYRGKDPALDSAMDALDLELID
jgi:hypothetical protein